MTPTELVAHTLDLSGQEKVGLLQPQTQLLELQDFATKDLEIVAMTSQTFLMFVDLLVDIRVPTDGLLVHLLDHVITSCQGISKEHHLRINGGQLGLQSIS